LPVQGDSGTHSSASKEHRRTLSGKRKSTVSSTGLSGFVIPATYGYDTYSVPISFAATPMSPVDQKTNHYQPYIFQQPNGQFLQFMFDGHQFIPVMSPPPDGSIGHSTDETPLVPVMASSADVM